MPAERLRDLERYPGFADNLALDDVAEDVLLHFFVADVVHFDARHQPVSEPAYAERAGDRRERVGEAGIPRIEHVLPERLVGVADGEVAEIPRVTEVEPRVDEQNRPSPDSA